MLKTRFLLLIAYTLCVVWGCNRKPDVRQPNIVIILADDMGWGDLGYTGNPLVNTPTLDSLAKNGATFDRFFVYPVCSPTRAALLTGRYAERGGVYSTSSGGERLDLDETTFAEVFKQAGYTTGAFGKWHNGMQNPYHPNARGFEEFLGYCSGHWGSYFNAMLEHNGQILQSEGYLTDVLTDRALHFLEENKEKPFLLYLPLNTPHSPMQVPDKWWKKFEQAELPTHANSDKEQQDHSRAAYAMTENIDWNVSRITNKLKELKLDDNTIIVFFSDNGPNGYRWNGAMRGIKGSTDEGGVRSPLIMAWKGKIQAGKAIAPIASVMDMFPTLLDMAGISFSAKKPLDGKSLKPLLIEEKPEWQERILVNQWNKRISVRSERFRLDHENKLYDIQADPGQIQDLSLQFPSEAASLLDVKQKWQEQVLSEIPDVDTRSFTIGHPSYPNDQLPARDGRGHGNIQRSNRHPNSTFFTNWLASTDSITWEVEVLEKGEFAATLYYTCKSEDVGSIFQLRMGENILNTTIIETHDPPLYGAENDRFPRIESYVKDFKALDMGKIALEKGVGTLSLSALFLSQGKGIDVRMLTLRRM